MTRLIEQTRYAILIGVISLLLAALTAFGWGALKTFYALVDIISNYGKHPNTAVDLIELVDAFDCNCPLYIFAVSLYELFIGKLALPGWMLAHNLYELKANLSSVIILVMAVKFLEKLMEWQDPQGTLLFGVAVALVSAALIALNYFKSNSAKE